MTPFELTLLNAALKRAQLTLKYRAVPNNNQAAVHFRRALDELVHALIKLRTYRDNNETES